MLNYGVISNCQYWTISGPYSNSSQNQYAGSKSFLTAVCCPRAADWKSLIQKKILEGIQGKFPVEPTEEKLEEILG